nr:hypothetical protein [Tanacetum cinerariifolium]
MPHLKYLFLVIEPATSSPSPTPSHETPRFISTLESQDGKCYTIQIWHFINHELNTDFNISTKKKKKLNLGGCDEFTWVPLKLRLSETWRGNLLGLQPCGCILFFSIRSLSEPHTVRSNAANVEGGCLLPIVDQNLEFENRRVSKPMAATDVTHRICQRTDALDAAAKTIASIGKAKGNFRAENSTGRLIDLYQRDLKQLAKDPEVNEYEYARVYIPFPEVATDDDKT